MEYKLCNPLKTRQVEPCEKACHEDKIFAMGTPPLTQNASAVRRAVEFGWYEGEKPDPDELSPAEVIALGTAVFQAYSAAMGFDAKNSRAARQTTPKA